MTEFFNSLGTWFAENTADPMDFIRAMEGKKTHLLEIYRPAAL